MEKWDSLLIREPAAQLNLRTLRPSPEQEADTQLTELPGTPCNLEKKKKVTGFSSQRARQSDRKLSPGLYRDSTRRLGGSVG